MAGVVTTTTINAKHVWGDQRVVDATLAFDTGDYAAGGVAVTASQFGLNSIQYVIPQPIGLEVAATPTFNLWQWVPATSKLRAAQSAAGDAPFAEKGAEAFGSGANLQVLVIGY